MNSRIVVSSSSVQQRALCQFLVLSCLLMFPFLQMQLMSYQLIVTIVTQTVQMVVGLVAIGDVVAVAIQIVKDRQASIIQAVIVKLVDITAQDVPANVLVLVPVLVRVALIR